MNETEIQRLFDTNRLDTRTIDEGKVDAVVLEVLRRRRSRTVRRRTTYAALVIVIAIVGAIGVQANSEIEIIASREEAAVGQSTISSTQTLATTTPISRTVEITSVTTLVETNNWALLGSGLAPRGGHSVIWVDDHLLIWGGFGDETGKTQFSDGALFDRTIGQWTPLPDSPLGPRWNQLTQARDQQVLIVGGNTGSFSETFSRQTAIFDLSAMSWQAIADAPFAVGAHTASQWIGNDLYLVDPATGESASFSLETRSWREIESLEGQSGYNNVVMVTQDDQLFAFQGRCGAIATSSLSHGSGEWEPQEERRWRAPSANSNGITHQYCLSTATNIDGEIFLWADPEDDETASLRLDTSVMQLNDRDSLRPSDGCEVPPFVQVFQSGQTIVFDDCGSAEVFDPAQQQWFNVESAKGSIDAVWTGDSVIVWGRPCCYGTGTSTPFVIEINEFLVDSLG